jgi:hypothetical protein
VHNSTAQSLLMQYSDRKTYVEQNLAGPVYRKSDLEHIKRVKETIIEAGWPARLQRTESQYFAIISPFWGVAG